MEDDRDLLIRMDERMENVQKLLERMQKNCDRQVMTILSDMEGLKTWKNKMVGAIAIISIVVSALTYKILDLRLI